MTENKDKKACNAAVDTGRRVDIDSLIVNRPKTIRRRSQKQNNYLSTKQLIDKEQKRKSKKISNSDTTAPVTQENISINEVKENPHPSVRLEKNQEKTITSNIETILPTETEWDESGDFAALLDEAGPIKFFEPNVGDKVDGKIIHISGDMVFLAIGPKYEASMPLSELQDKEGNILKKIGDNVTAFIVSIADGIKLSKKSSEYIDMQSLQQTKQAKIPIEGRVISVNKGGYEIQLAGCKGFCPLGQIDIAYIDEPQTMVNQQLLFLISEISDSGKNIVLSRKALLQKEKDDRAKATLSKLSEGDIIEGTVSRVVDFGAFVDIGGIDALVPLSQLSFTKIKSASEAVSVGDKVNAQITSITPDSKKEGKVKIALSVTSILPDPFDSNKHKLTIGANVEGRVIKLEDFGAFVEVFPGVDGLIHISELSHKKIRHPQEILQIGQDITARILGVDFDSKRISLSLKEDVKKDLDSADEIIYKTKQEKSYGERNSISQHSLGTLGDLLAKKLKK